MPTTVGISFFKGSPKGELSYKVKKAGTNACLKKSPCYLSTQTYFPEEALVHLFSLDPYPTYRNQIQ